MARARAGAVAGIGAVAEGADMPAPLPGLLRKFAQSYFSAHRWEAIRIGPRAWALPGPGRVASLVRMGALAVAACVAAHVLFAAATLAGSGHLPDWGQYLAYLNQFLFGQVGDITYDYSHWSAGLPVGAAYLASAAAFVLVIRRRRDLVDTHRAALVSLCGITAYG